MRVWLLPVVMVLLVVAAIAYFAGLGNQAGKAPAPTETVASESSDSPVFDPANFVVPPGARRILMKQPCYESATLWELRRTLLDTPGLLDVDIAGGWLIVVFEDEMIEFAAILDILDRLGCPMSRIVYDKRGRERTQE